MAESIISPGVYTRENDISYITPTPIQAGAAFVGPTVKGPDNQPLIVTSYSDYVRKFGETFLSASDKPYEFLTSVAVKNYFQNGGQTALVTRIVSGAYLRAANTHIAGAPQGVNKATGSGTLAAAAVDGQKYSIVYGSNTYLFVASDDPIPSDQPASNVWYFSTGSDADGTVDNLVQQINDAAAYLPVSASKASTGVLALSGSAAGTAYNLITFKSGSTSAPFSDPDFTVVTIEGGTNGASTNYPFTIETLGKGTLYNNSTGLADAGVENSDGSLVSGSADNVRWEVSNVNSALGTFSLIVRQGNDSTNNKTILETFNVSLDPNSDNYIERVIGNQYVTVATDSSTGVSYNTLVGEYPNASNYIRVASVALTTPNYLSNDGITVNTNTAGVSYSTYLPIASSGSFCDAIGAVKEGARFFGDIANADTQGIVADNYTTALSLLANKDEYQFNIVSAPGLVYKNSNFTSTVNAFISLAESRGDCIAVVDLVGLSEPAITNVTAQAASLNSSYAATYWPWLQIKSATGRNEWIPAGTVIPGVYAFTDAAAAPWFAPAGLVRGGIGGVIQAERKLTKGDRDVLYSAKVNPIATFPGSGIAVFGQKTLQTKASALDRVNVRRLLIELKKFIGDQARNLVFEQNTIATRNRFLATVNPYLESVIQRQGLYAYRVVMDDTNNTADVVDRNQLIGQILIQPTKTVEFVVLDFTIEPTGATFA
jgi:phage tail sheath protein FI